MITFIIKSSVCALALYIIYILLLENEKMHRVKRFYLLVSLAISIVAPLLTLNFGNWKGIEGIVDRYDLEISQSDAATNISDTESVLSDNFTDEITDAPLFADSPEKPFNAAFLISALYSAVSAFLLFRLIRNLYKITVQKERDFTIDKNGNRIVLIDSNIAPHSFWKFIFLNSQNYRSGQIPGEILIHEQAHIRQKHYIDLIFIELVLVIFWFNPIFYLYKSKIKQNHEFLADEEVIDCFSDTGNYLQLLYNSILQQGNPLPVSCFNYSITKKRFTMMTKTTSQTRAICKILALIPAFTAAVLVFSAKTTAQDNIIPFPTVALMDNEIDYNETFVLESGASEELMAKYKAFTKKYLDSIQVKKNGADTIFHWRTREIARDDYLQNFIIYAKMNKEQQVKQLIRFHSPFFDRRWLTKVPTAKIWKQFQDTTLYTVFLDDKPVDNAYLKTISRWKIAFYWSNMPNKQKDGKIYLYLFTKEGYESLKKQSSQPITVENLVKYSPHIGFKSDFHKSTKNGKPLYIIGEMAGDVAEK